MDQRIREAIEDHKNGRLEAARKGYEAILTEKPDDPQLYRYYAYLLAEIDRPDLAIEALQEALQRISVGDNSTAETSGHTIVDDGLVFSNVSIAAELANLLAAQGNLAEAKNLIIRAVDENPEDILAHELLIKFLGYEWRTDKAMELYYRAPAKVRSSFFVCVSLAEALVAADRIEEGIAHRNKGLGLPEGTLCKIRTHAFPTVRNEYMVSHVGAPPHSEVTVVNPKCEGDNSPVYVSLKNATVLSGEWYVLSGRNTLFFDVNHGTPTGYPPYYLPGRLAPQPALENRCILPKPDRPVFHKAILAGGDTNYFHWVTDFFPRLLALSATPDLDQLPILMHERLAPYQREALDLAGISEDRVRCLDYPACYPCDELIVPLFPAQPQESAIHHGRPKALTWLRSLVAPSTGTGRRLYVSRQDCQRRRIVNEEVLIGPLKKEGFEILSLEGASLREQIDLFSQASVIVGGHGAGLANIAFAPDHCRVIEVANPGWNLPYYENLALALGQRYTKVMARDFLTERTLGIFWDFFVTDQAVDQVIRLVREG